MNKEIAAAWRTALRSGDFVQTTGALRRTVVDSYGRPAGHCCLGVLCELAVQAKVIPPGREILEFRPSAYQPGCMRYGTAGHESSVGLPVAVRVWAGMETCTGLLLGDVKDTALAQLNDSGRTFSEIADIIEKFETKL